MQMKKPKKVLIIGANSYIAKSFAEFTKTKSGFEITAVSSRDNAWSDIDFAQYDSILHCAGIAHIKQKTDMKSLYYEINCDLAVQVAKKAANDGVRQFVFLSSVAAIHHDNGDLYGASKLKAEQELENLVNEYDISDDIEMKLCIVRPPMVYGIGCKGNFPKLVKLARILPIFPNYPNRRSMIYIDNLCEFLYRLIEREASGSFLPQNKEYVNTTELVKIINKRVITTRLFNPLIKQLAKKRGSIFEKLFGDLLCERVGDESEYNIVEFEESVRLCQPHE